MKAFKNLLITSLVLSSFSSWSQTASETSREINAQTTITRGHIDNVLERISRQRPNSPFRASDFWPQSKDLKVKVEAALVKFEDKLEKEILAKAAYWMDQYNAIYLSQDYSKAQKAVLLKQREDFIRNQFVLLSQDYQKALSEVYSLIPQYDLTYRYEYDRAIFKTKVDKQFTKKIDVKLISNKNVTFSTWFKITSAPKKSDPRFYDYFFVSKDAEGDLNKWVEFDDGDDGVKKEYVNDIFDRTDNLVLNFNEMKLKHSELEISLFQKLIYPAIKGTCQSSICLGLRAGDFSTLLESIKTLIDRDMKLALASGVELEIKGLNYDTTLISQMLNSVDYPETLPFDI